MSQPDREQYFQRAYSPTLKLAGDQGYGRWHKSLADLSEQPKIWQDWEDRVVRVSLAYQNTQFLDAGCGNGAYSIPHAVRFARRCQTVTAHLVDLQAVGIEEAGQFINQSDLPPNITFSLQTASLTELPIADQTIHGIITNQVMHWIDHEQTLQSFEEFRRVLVPNGYVLIDTGSIYNAMALGKNNPELLEQVQAATNNGKSKKRYTEWHKGFQRNSHLFTEPGLRQSLHHAGLTIRRLNWYKNNFPNGQSNKYKEGLRVIAQKTE